MSKISITGFDRVALRDALNIYFRQLSTPVYMPESLLKEIKRTKNLNEYKGGRFNCSHCAGGSPEIIFSESGEGITASMTVPENLFCVIVEKSLNDYVEQFESVEDVAYALNEKFVYVGHFRPQRGSGEIISKIKKAQQYSLLLY